MRCALMAVLTAGLCGGLCGCEWGIPAFEPEGVPYVAPPKEFRQLTGNELGAAHAYVVGISEDHIAAGNVRPVIDASLRGETFPSTRPVEMLRETALRARSEAVADSAMKADVTAGLGNAKTNIGPTQVEQSEPVRPSLRPLPASAPATSLTADLNDDGFVTLDEIVAMHRAGVPAAEIAQRLEATGYRLAATRTQLDQLRAFGVEDAAMNPLRKTAAAVRPPRATTEMR